MAESNFCEKVPNLLSSFVDTFIDFTVSGGLFLPPPITPTTPLQTTYPSPDRLIAIGDLHGDLNKSKQVFRLAGLIDSDDHWTGRSSTIVQVGDVLDRGDDEIKILYFLERLKREAYKNGGNLITMNGNHEIMNVDGDFRYVTKWGLNEFRVWANWYCVGNVMKRLCGVSVGDDLFDGVPLDFPGVRPEILDGVRARIAALRPNGPIAKRFLTTNVTVLVMGDSVFVHGGLLPQHVFYGLDRINEEVRDWIGGFMQRVSSELVRGRNSLVWLWKFSDELAKNCDCSTLEHVLATIPGVRRMIMGHTIQEKGINGVCGNKAIRIDVGMSRGCINGLPQVLEINGESQVWVLTNSPLYRNGYESSFVEDAQKGIGVVARDSKGELILAKTVRVHEVLDSVMVEVMAIKEALSWTKNSTWQNIIVESDCLVAVQAIRSKVPMISPFGLIVEECRRMLQDKNTVSLSFIKRSANMVAHELARASYSFPDRYFDRSSVPIEVDVALKDDLY